MRYLQRRTRRRPPLRLDRTRPIGHACRMVGTDFDRLADFAVSRRVALGLEREDVAARMNKSAKTVERIELGHSVRRETLASLEQALEWEPGSTRRVLEGGVPTPTRDDAVPTAPAAGQLTPNEQRLVDVMVELKMEPATIAQALLEYRQRTAAKRSEGPFLQVSDSDTK